MLAFGFRCALCRLFKAVLARPAPLARPIVLPAMPVLVLRDAERLTAPEALFAATTAAVVGARAETCAAQAAILRKASAARAEIRPPAAPARVSVVRTRRARFFPPI